MPRYIDADLAENLLLDGYTIDEVPSADVEPVRHLRWKHEEKQIGIQKYQMEHHIVCPECQSRYNIVYVYLLLGEGKLFIRCPHCGAKMDEEEDT